MRCFLCPLKCGADREKRAGACGAKGIAVAKFYLHPFEEPFLSPNFKSGTVFFSGCSLRCVFCQNFPLSRAERGREITPRELSDIFRSLEDAGAENIDLVTPDHLIPFLKEAFEIYRPRVPVVFNSSGFSLVPALEEIAPYIDIWLPDMKFASPLLAGKFTGREDYPLIAREAIAFMAKKSPAWEGDRLLRGIAVRHLVLPAHTEDSKAVLDILSKILPPAAPLSIMRQYTPMGDIQGFPELSRRVTDREYRKVVEYALSLGFENVFTQEKESADQKFIPDWDE